MGSLTIRNLDDDTKARLRVAAARAGHSMEEHVRKLIADDVHAPDGPARGFGTWMHQLFEGSYDSGFVAPERDGLAEPVDLPE